MFNSLIVMIASFFMLSSNAAVFPLTKDHFKFPLNRECLKPNLIDVQQGLPSNVAITFQLKSECPWYKKYVTNLKQTEKGPGVRVADNIEGLKKCEVVNDSEKCKVDWLESRKLRRNTDLEAFNASFNAPISFKVDVMILLDLSGSIKDDRKAMTNLKESTIKFVDKVFETKEGNDNRPINVSVYSFDGREGVRSILLDGQTSSNDPAILKSAITSALENCEERGLCFDKSTNLYGGILEGLNELVRISRNGPEKIRAKQFIVFTDGKDRAGRTSIQTVYEAVENFKQKGISIYAVGLGKNIDQLVLTNIAGDKFIHAKKAKTLGKKFVSLAESVREYANSFFTVRYCSAKRYNGKSKEHLVVYKRNIPYGYQLGVLDFEYQSNDFEGGCDPTEDTQWENLR